MTRARYLNKLSYYHRYTSNIICLILHESTLSIMDVYRKTFCLQQEGIYLYVHIAAVTCDPPDSYKLYTHVIPHLCLHLLSYS